MDVPDSFLTSREVDIDLNYLANHARSPEEIEEDYKSIGAVSPSASDKLLADTLYSVTRFSSEVKNFTYHLPLFSEKLPRIAFIPKCLRMARKHRIKLIVLFDSEEDWSRLESSMDSEGLTIGDVSMDVSLKSETRDPSGRSTLTWLSIPEELEEDEEDEEDEDEDKDEDEDDEEDAGPGASTMIPEKSQEYFVAILRFDDWSIDGYPPEESFEGFMSLYQQCCDQIACAADSSESVHLMLADIGARLPLRQDLWGPGPRATMFAAIDAVFARACAARGLGSGSGRSGVTTVAAGDLGNAHPGASPCEGTSKTDRSRGASQRSVLDDLEMCQAWLTQKRKKLGPTSTTNDGACAEEE